MPVVYTRETRAVDFSITTLHLGDSARSVASIGGRRRLLRDRDARRFGF